ncbi:MAG: hypothetical protein E7A50_05225 [Clostridiales bacterium]|nr:hypothetical protein [Clostridiales bacterium]
MALLTDVATLSLSCFNQDEIEDMLQWHVLQNGNFIDTTYGTYTHLHNTARHMHFFHYLEDDGNDAGNEEKDVPWRLDLHVDTGKKGNIRATLDPQIVEDIFASVDNRFNNLVPILAKFEESGAKEGTALLVDFVNKNMLPADAKGSEFEMNLNVSVLDIDFFESRAGWIEKEGLSPDQVDETPGVFPLGMVINQMMQDDEAEEVDEQAIGLMRYAAQDLRINPLGLMNINGVVESVEDIHLGNNVYNYILGVKTDLGVFYAVVPERFVQVEEVTAGNYVALIGFFSGIYIGEPEKQGKKENVVPFAPVH